jgi:hypothetical protein
MDDLVSTAGRGPVATKGSWSWRDVGKALGMTGQAADQKLRARSRDEMAKGALPARGSRRGRSGEDHTTRQPGRERLDRAAAFSPKNRLSAGGASMNGNRTNTTSSGGRSRKHVRQSPKPRGRSRKSLTERRVRVSRIVLQWPTMTSSLSRQRALPPRPRPGH